MKKVRWQWSFNYHPDYIEILVKDTKHGELMWDPIHVYRPNWWEVIRKRSWESKVREAVQECELSLHRYQTELIEARKIANGVLKWFRSPH